MAHGCNEIEGRVGVEITVGRDIRGKRTVGIVVVLQDVGAVVEEHVGAGWGARWGVLAVGVEDESEFTRRCPRQGRGGGEGAVVVVRGQVGPVGNDDGS